MAEQTRLADVLQDWLKHRRPVTIKHIERTTGVSRNTINLIVRGTTAEPEPETLRKIARGLATDEHDGAFYASIYLEALRDFSEATGLPDLAADLPPCDLETEIRVVVKDPKRANILAAFIRRYPNMNAGDRRLVDSVLDKLGDQE